MKILFTQDALVNAGAERSHLEILSRFSEEVDVGFVYFYPKDDLKKAYQRAGIRLFFLDIPESYHFILAIRRLVKLIRQEKPDLLVSSLWRADIITRIASWITGVPLVGTLVNDSYAPLAWTDKKGLKYKVVYWLDRLTSSIPIHWIANAEALTNSHVKMLGIKKDKISVVYRGRPVPKPRSLPVPQMEGLPKPELNHEKSVDCEDIVQGDHSHRSVSLQAETTNRNFISYGRLLERKGFQDAIYAFSEVQKKYPDCSLTIFGEGPYRRELERQVHYLGLEKTVFLPGKIPNPIDTLIDGFYLEVSNTSKPQHKEIVSSTSKSTICVPAYRKNYQQLTKAHCFLFPSWYEGFSGALIEAMMAGMPIIASDIPMNLEAIENQKSALVFPVKDVKVLSEKMLWAIENPEVMTILGSKAQKTAKERFDIDKIAMQYEEMLFQVAKRKKIGEPKVKENDL